MVPLLLILATTVTTSAIFGDDHDNHGSLKSLFIQMMMEHFAKLSLYPDAVAANDTRRSL